MVKERYKLREATDRYTQIIMLLWCCIGFVVQEDDPVKVRWAHLGLLVDFAFELVRALQSINEQSFNHFVLRMGKYTNPTPLFLQSLLSILS